MRLKDWIKDNKMSVRVMAKTIGITENYLYCLIAGRANASTPLAKLIESYTNGHVTVDEQRAGCQYKGLDSKRLCEAIVAGAGIDKFNLIMKIYHEGVK